MKYLILSDLHIGDGSAKDDFLYDEELVSLLRDMMEESEVVLILNGDTLELVESDIIKSMGLIPFNDLLEKVPPELIDSIVSKHPEIFKTFREFSRKHRIVYVVGNHDYYVLKNRKISERLTQFMGNIDIKPYFYIEEISTLVIHGNQFDIINRFTKDKKTGKLIPPLGDYIIRYMMVNFDEYIEGFVPKNVIRDYDNVRPPLDVFNWFEYVVEAYNIGEDLLELWTRNFLQLMRTDTAKNWMKKNYPILRFSSKIFLNNFGGIKLGEIIVRLMMKMRTLRRTDYLLTTARKLLLGERKLKKSDFLGFDENPDLDMELKGLIMGHIHHSAFEVIPVNGGYKFYMNCGSWRPVVEKLNTGRKGFQKKAELFYGFINVTGRDIEIVTNSKNKLEELLIT